MHANYLDTLDWGILIAYFLILIGIGIWASLKRKKGSSLFLAERSLKWHHIGFSMWGTNVGPSMLIASASAGFTTGIVSGNYAWYAFVFICLLAFVFAPRYLGARITTLPEFMGRRFGQSTRNILAWYTIVTILISWLALTLFAGGILIRQVFDIPMWQSALILLVISAFFTMAGGLKAVAYTNVFQMLLLIFVSATLTIAGLYKVGGVSALAEAVPADYWNLFRPNDDPAFPWLPIILGYPIMGVWFWCTDQSMVQPVLAAKNLKEGQMGANFTGWLKILDVPLYILPGIICLALYPGLKNPDEAYMTMVTNLFPVGMVGVGTGRIDRRTDQHCQLCPECAEYRLHDGYLCQEIQATCQPERDHPYGTRGYSGGSTDFGDHHHCHRQYQRIESVQCIPIGTGIYRTAYGGCFPVRHLLETNYHDGCQHGIDAWHGVQHGSGHSLFMGISCGRIYDMASLHDAVFLPVRYHQRRHDLGILIG